MEDSANRHAVANLLTTSAKFLVFGILIGLTSDDSNGKSGYKILAKLREQLAGRFRIMPIGAVEEQNRGSRRHQLTSSSTGSCSVRSALTVSSSSIGSSSANRWMQGSR